MKRHRSKYSVYFTCSSLCFAYMRYINGALLHVPFFLCCRIFFIFYITLHLISYCTGFFSSNISLLWCIGTFSRNFYLIFNKARLAVAPLSFAFFTTFVYYTYYYDVNKTLVNVMLHNLSVTITTF